MKKTLLALSVLLFIAPSILVAQENKLNIKFGGFVEFKGYYDSYRSRASRYDLTNYYPLSPKMNNAGEDINNTGSLNFSISTSRLYINVGGIKLLNADVNSYFEADFCGSTEAYIGMFNLRHAYINMKWKKSSLLIGQTDHLTYVGDVNGQTVAFGAGFPFNSLNRNIQIRYTANLAKNVNLIVAAHMFGGTTSLGPAKAQAQAGIPDLQAQIRFGDPAKVFGGITAGYKVLKPRTTDALNNLISTSIGSFDINAFFRAALGKGYTLRMWGIYGENLSHLGMIGGYGKINDVYLGSSNPLLDYKYENVRSMSSWIDFETPSFKDFKFGIFYGYQKSFGTKDVVDITMANGDYSFGFYKDPKLMWFSRLSPRVVYSASKKLIFALEYSLSQAKWAKTIDTNLKGTDFFPVNHNNRIEFMAKYVF
ncbi:MAG TPA: hypothetical protein PK115_06045 [Bacteroidales bacterium]|nr:hypothetical protein [Bacteroidales bacterium]